jgi:hypothetical protein
VQVLQRGSRVVGAQLLHQPCPQLPVVLHGVGSAPGLVRGNRAVAGDPLVQRTFGGPCGRLGHLVAAPP